MEGVAVDEVEWLGDAGVAAVDLTGYGDHPAVQGDPTPGGGREGEGRGGEGRGGEGRGGEGRGGEGRGGEGRGGEGRGGEGRGGGGGGEGRGGEGRGGEGRGGEGGREGLKVSFTVVFRLVVKKVMRIHACADFQIKMPTVCEFSSSLLDSLLT